MVLRAKAGALTQRFRGESIGPRQGAPADSASNASLRALATLAGHIEHNTEPRIQPARVHGASNRRRSISKRPERSAVESAASTSRLPHRVPRNHASTSRTVARPNLRLRGSRVYRRPVEQRKARRPTDRLRRKRFGLRGRESTDAPRSPRKATKTGDPVSPRKFGLRLASLPTSHGAA